MNDSKLVQMMGHLSGYRLYPSHSLNTGLLFLRFYAGITIMGAGLDKLPLTDWMIDQVAQMGFPFPVFFGWLASFSEFAFGLLLALGLMTRFSGIMLAISMGVASFGFQKVMPLVEMHIAQLYTWSFVLFIFSGAGRWSLDHVINKRGQSGLGNWYFTGPLALTLLLLYGLFREFSAEVTEETDPAPFVIETISIPGSFNDWDPNSLVMSTKDSTLFEAVLNIKRAGPVEFKFAANGSWDYNLGEMDQDGRRFPVRGTVESNAEGEAGNIEAYLPAAGSYWIMLNLHDSSYSLDSLQTRD